MARKPSLRDLYTPQVEKTNVILPVDDQAVEPKEGIIHLHPARRVRTWFGLLGPGVVTGASDDDPSGIGTYSVAGAQFGYQTLWLALVSYPLSAAVQEVCARIGLVTGHGLAAVTKRHYHRSVLFLVTSLLLVANVINIGADIQAMAASFQLLFPSLEFSVIAVGITAFTLLLLVGLSYKTYARYLKMISVVLFSYVLVAFLSNVDWESALRHFLVPTLTLSPVYLMTLVGILGTTISPYMFFWQANEEVEEEISKGLIRKDDPETHHPSLLKLDRKVIREMYFDVNAGMFYSELIMFFIIVSTAANLYSDGKIHGVEDLSIVQMAEVLRPLVGDTAFFLFTVGILGIGLLAVPVLAGSASYAVSELFGWKEGLNKKFHEAKQFYFIIIAATLVGLLLNFTGVHPVAALYYTAVINGIVAAPLLFIIWRMGNNKKIVGEHTSGILSNVLVFSTIVIMAAAAVAMFVYSF